MTQECLNEKGDHFCNIRREAKSEKHINWKGELCLVYTNSFSEYPKTYPNCTKYKCMISLEHQMQQENDATEK